MLGVSTADSFSFYFFMAVALVLLASFVPFVRLATFRSVGVARVANPVPQFRRIKVEEEC